MCIHEYFQLVLCWEVCPLSECPSSEVSLYYPSYISQAGVGEKVQGIEMALALLEHIRNNDVAVMEGCDKVGVVLIIGVWSDHSTSSRCWHCIRRSFYRLILSVTFVS